QRVTLVTEAAGPVPGGFFLAPEKMTDWPPVKKSHHNGSYFSGSLRGRFAELLCLSGKSFPAIRADQSGWRGAGLLAGGGGFSHRSAGSPAHVAGGARRRAVPVLRAYAPGHAAGGGLSGLSGAEWGSRALSRAPGGQRLHQGPAGLPPDQPAVAVAL